MVSTPSPSTDERRRLVSSKDKQEPWKFELTINIEVLRFFSIFAISALFGTGAVLKRCIFTDIDEIEAAEAAAAGRDLIGDGDNMGLLRGAKDAVVSQISETMGWGDNDGGRNLGLLDFNLFGHPFCEPYVRMQDTFIWKTFGFEHTCSYIDYNPFAEIFAIFIPLFTLPMIAYLLASLLRAKVLVNNVRPDGTPKAQPYLYTLNKWITFPCIACISIVHLWFVNKPDAVYPDGYGFIAHYIPYALYQWVMSLIAIEQLHFYLATDTKFPFGLSDELGEKLGKFYARFFAALTFIYQCIVFSILYSENPLLDSANNPTHKAIFQLLTQVYKYLILYAPLVLSFYGILYGESNTITFGLD